MFTRGFAALALGPMLAFSQSTVEPVTPLPDSTSVAPAESAALAWTSPVFTADPARGGYLYRKNCEICHGKKGDGQGPAARFLEPRPRDFSKGTYKLRTTPTGTLPTDRDLMRTVSKGLAGTAMTGFSGLLEEERWQVVQYVKSFSKRFAENPPPVPAIWTSRQPETGDSVLARGKVFYDALECAKCHGSDGRGNGPSAYSLKDSQERPIFAFDMTRGRKMKSGPGAGDIFRVLMTGLDGTPMPSYQESISESEAWALSLYVKSLFVDE